MGDSAVVQIRGVGQGSGDGELFGRWGVKGFTKGKLWGEKETGH